MEGATWKNTFVITLLSCRERDSNDNPKTWTNPRGEGTTFDPNTLQVDNNRNKIDFLRYPKLPCDAF
jgi:hypothetical protein